jgi:hypothetical protein
MPSQLLDARTVWGDTSDDSLQRQDVVRIVRSRSKRQRVRSGTSEVSYSAFSRLHRVEHASCFRAGSKEETREVV